MRKFPVLASSFWHPIYRNRFRAALLVTIGATGFSMLEPPLRVAVDQKCDQINKALGNILPWGVTQRGFEPDVDYLAAWHGVAMAHLELTTGVDGLTWSEFLSAWSMRDPGHAYGAFRRSPPATDDAIAYLATTGFEMAPRIQQSHAWLAAARQHYP